MDDRGFVVKWKYGAMPDMLRGEQFVVAGNQFKAEDQFKELFQKLFPMVNMRRLRVMSVKEWRNDG